MLVPLTVGELDALLLLYGSETLSGYLLENTPIPLAAALVHQPYVFATNPQPPRNFDKTSEMPRSFRSFVETLNLYLTPETVPSRSHRTASDFRSRSSSVSDSRCDYECSTCFSDEDDEDNDFFDASSYDYNEHPNQDAESHGNADNAQSFNREYAGGYYQRSPECGRPDRVRHSRRDPQRDNVRFRGSQRE